MAQQMDVQLVTLEDMRVISFHGFGKNPENLAWQKLRDWMVENNHQDWIETQRFFGFNNPNPAPGSENYGYEQWITLPEGFEPQEEDTIKALQGGLYAMNGFRDQSLEAFGPAWQALNNWRTDSEYLYDESRMWLEELLTKESVLHPSDKGSFNCYMPVVRTNG